MKSKMPLPQYLINAEAFMRANLSREVSIADIANAAGCTERAIVRIFEQYRKAHPTTALASLREFQLLKAVRKPHSE